MKFYYNDSNGYECTWKTSMKGNYWYNMEPVVVKVRVPIEIYNQIKKDIILKNEDIRELKDKGLEDIFHFKILKQKNEKVRWGVYSSDDVELWNFTAILDRISYTSKFTDNTVMAHINCLIQEHGKSDISEVRELLLNELV